MDALADRVLRGERGATARALSVIERKDAAAGPLLERLWPHTGRALRIGITGAPGVGKSTLVDALCGELSARRGKVGVIAVDPTSPFTGGALLGDRIRMQRSGMRDDVFIRSMASRGRSGGLAPEASEAADVLDAAGFGVVVIETVGVGQGEWDVAFEADLTVVVLAPGAGDGIQALKAGIMEVADLFCVNKADLPGAEAVRDDVEQALDLGERARGGKPPVLLVEAGSGRGSAELAERLFELETALRQSPAFEARRREALARRLVARAAERGARAARNALALRPAWFEDLVARRFGVDEALRRLEAGRTEGGSGR